MEVKYQNDGKTAYYNGYQFIRDDKTGYYLSSTKIGTRRKRLHVYVYECERGQAVPVGYQIHHIDGDKSHNDISNLACIPLHDHLSYHSQTYANEHKEEMTKQLEDIRPKASQWHASAEGHEWHKKHYAKMKDALYVKRTFKCLVCGKEFESTKVDSKFCCNAHKTRYRKSLGLDNETRKCVVCGRNFSANKYQPTKTCSKECKKVLLRISRMKNKEAAS
jgi:predicted nucleic acid-binding Zn ribbon protein